MRNYRIIVALVTLALVAVGCNAKYTGPEREFTNDEFNVGFNPPSGWAAGKADVDEQVFAAYEAPGEEIASVDLMIFAFEKGEKPVKQARKVLDQTSGVEISTISLLKTDADKDCDTITYTWPEGNVKHKGLMTIIHNTEYIAILIFTTTEKDFEKHRETFEKCAKSLCFGR